MNKQERKIWEQEQLKRAENKQILTEQEQIMFDKLIEQCAIYDINIHKARSLAQIKRDVIVEFARIQLIYDLFYLPWPYICDKLFDKRDELKEKRSQELRKARNHNE